jgi:hypothetical protein
MAGIKFRAALATENIANVAFNATIDRGNRPYYTISGRTIQ